MSDKICPKCKGKSFDEIDCGPDTYEDDLVWSSFKCIGCGLWYSEWQEKWLLDCDSWRDEEDAEEYHGI